MRTSLVFLFLFLGIFSLAFLPKKGDASATRYYGDLNTATPRDLPTELAEISAMAYDGKENAIYAVTDESGILYQFQLTTGTLQRRNFYGAGDFEGLARVGNTFYALISNGDLVEFPLGAGNVEGRKHDANFSGKTEFESLYYDGSTRKLVLLCKQCSEGKKSTVSAYFFDPSTKKFSPSSLRFSTKDVNRLSKGKKDEPLRASDAALNPITGELYILASINNLLVVTDGRTGAFKGSYDLDRKLFKQPEAICFSPRGDLFISNEAGGKGAATLLEYKYRR